MNKTIQKHLDELKALFPNYDFKITYTKKISEQTQTKIIKDFIKDLKQQFPMFNFRFKTETYDAKLLLFISSKKDQEDISYYKNDDCGYIIYNTNYFEVLKQIETMVNENNIKCSDYIENNRTGSLYFYY